MKFIVYLILLIPCSVYSQAWQLDSVEFEGETYLLYPEKKVVGRFIGVRNWMCDTNLYCGGLPKDGVWIQFFKEDTIQPARIWSYANKGRHGEWNEFHINGQLKDSGMYVNDQKEGLWKSFYENGQLKSLKNYNKGESTGNWIVYFENGNIDREGISDSIHTEYYKNGQKKIEHIFFDFGQKTSQWFSNGQLEYSQTYIGGRLKDTIQTFYYSNGQISAQGMSENGAFVGNWKYYYKNGQISSSGEYLTFESMSTDYVPSVRYLSYQSGEWIHFYETGKLMAKGTFNLKPKISKPGVFTQHKVEPVKNNDWKYFDEDGTPTTYEKIKDLIE